MAGRGGGGAERAAAWRRMARAQRITSLYLQVLGVQEEWLRQGPPGEAIRLEPALQALRGALAEVLGVTIQQAEGMLHGPARDRGILPVEAL